MLDANKLQSTGSRDLPSIPVHSMSGPEGVELGSRVSDVLLPITEKSGELDGNPAMRTPGMLSLEGKGRIDSAH
jgi:hypothetical protein